MTKVLNLIARRDGTDFLLFRDGEKFGRLADCEICHVFLSDSNILDELVQARISGDMSIREMLAVVRQAVEEIDAHNEDEAEWMAQEGINPAVEWPYCHEALADLARHEAYGF